MRGGLPHAVESTWYITEAILTDSLLLSGISTFAVKSCYCTALCRFVTGLLDSEQDSRYKQSMFDKARELNLPAYLVDLRHEAIHGEMPSLVVLRQSALKSLDWLKNDYWKYLDEENVLTDTRTSPFTNGRTALKNDLKDLLQAHVNTFRSIEEVPKGREVDALAQAATEATLEFVQMCMGNKRALLDLVDLLVHHQMLIPGRER